MEVGLIRGAVSDSQGMLAAIFRVFLVFVDFGGEPLAASSWTWWKGEKHAKA